MVGERFFILMDKSIRDIGYKIKKMVMVLFNHLNRIFIRVSILNIYILFYFIKGHWQNDMKHGCG